MKFQVNQRWEASIIQYNAHLLSYDFRFELDYCSQIIAFIDEDFKK